MFKTTISSGNTQMGFTLLELLVAMAITGILAAIAIPQYNNYKKRAFDVRAREDLRNIATAEEAYFFDNESYLSCINQTCTTLPGIASLSNGVELTIQASETSFRGNSKHPHGTGKTFLWDSERGGLVGE